MIIRIIFIVTIIFKCVIAADRGDICITPNRKTGSCIPVETCPSIYESLRTTLNATAIEYARKSQCGYDSRPLVCCEPTSSDTSNTLIDTEGNEVNLENFDSNLLPDRSVCGLAKEGNRLVGGNITGIDEFPWMAALEYKSTSTGESIGIKCGGTLINNRWVLTAAHCLIGFIDMEPIRVWLGEWRLTTNPDCQSFGKYVECGDEVVKLRIKQSLPHPYYSKMNRNNDIGLLLLERDIEPFTEYIRPICLPPANLPSPQINAFMTITGWGNVKEDGPMSDYKLKVDVPLLANDDCIAKLTTRLLPNQLCAGGVKGKDACFGDSGGPLMRIYRDKNTGQLQWYQEGVISYGRGCGAQDVPAVYTRVSRYTQWIISHLS